MPQPHAKAPHGRNALIALGSNATSLWGDARETIQKSMSEIGKSLGEIRAKSEFYATPAFPAGAGPDFVNAAIRVRTNLDAAEIMIALHQIEAEAGRTRVVRWGQRTLDLDLIGLDDVVLPNLQTHQYWRDLGLDAQAKTAPEQLIVPHPRVQDRSFVLVPLCDVAAQWVHPILGVTVQQMHDDLPQVDLDGVRAI